MAIKTFQHKGLEKFFFSGSKAGIQPAHANKLRSQLGRLNVATKPSDMNVPGWKFHPLPPTPRYAVWVNGNWRLTFEFEGTDPVLVDYEDYH